MVDTRNIARDQSGEKVAIFQQSVDELGQMFSVRLYNYLKNANLQTMAAIVKKTEEELARDKKLGRRALEELKEFLGRQSLHLGMSDDEVMTWLPPDPSRHLF